MKKDLLSLFGLCIASIILLLGFSSCTAKKDEQKADSATVRVVQAAHTQGYVPYGYVNDSGDSDGFEISVLRAVDELLPEYEFTFVPTSDEDLLIGLEAGKYQLASKGAWFTEERAKKYLFPRTPIAASIIGLSFRTSDADTIRDMDSFAEYSGKLVPISPQSAQYSIIQEYNEGHPEKPIKLVPSDTFIINDAYIWVLEGRYDGFLDIKLSFQNTVLNEDGANHQFADKLSWIPYKGIPTWPLFAKEEQELAAAYDAAMGILKENGRLAELSEQFFGEDVFQYVSE